MDQGTEVENWGLSLGQAWEACADVPSKLSGAQVLRMENKQNIGILAECSLIQYSCC